MNKQKRYNNLTQCVNVEDGDSDLETTPIHTTLLLPAVGQQGSPNPQPPGNRV